MSVCVSVCQFCHGEIGNSEGSYMVERHLVTLPWERPGWRLLLNRFQIVFFAMRQGHVLYSIAEALYKQQCHGIYYCVNLCITHVRSAFWSSSKLYHKRLSIMARFTCCLVVKYRNSPTIHPPLSLKQNFCSSTFNPGYDLWPPINSTSAAMLM